MRGDEFLDRTTEVSKCMTASCDQCFTFAKQKFVLTNLLMKTKKFLWSIFEKDALPRQRKWLQHR